MNYLITGTSSGLGKSLASNLYAQGHNIWGISRSDSPSLNKSVKCDFSHLESIEESLANLELPTQIDCVILNAGILGNLDKQEALSHYDYQRVFNINFFANKIIMDFLLDNHKVNLVLAVSSGAANKGYYGWGPYCCSKAAFKQLIECYSIENPEIHFLNIAPGLIKTKMQDEIIQTSSEKIPSLSKFHAAYNSMCTPDAVAKKLLDNLDGLIDNNNSGAFTDLRDI